MTIEAEGEFLGDVLIGTIKLTSVNGELTVMGRDSALTAIRVLSDDELEILPYITNGKYGEFKKSNPEVLVKEQINAANIEGLILEESPDIYYRINWRPSFVPPAGVEPAI